MVLIGSCSLPGTRYGSLNQDFVVRLRAQPCCFYLARGVENSLAGVNRVVTEMGARGLQAVEEMHAPKDLKKNHWTQLHVVVMCDGKCLRLFVMLTIPYWNQRLYCHQKP